jgi:hypothetical protein
LAAVLSFDRRESSVNQFSYVTDFDFDLVPQMGILDGAGEVDLALGAGRRQHIRSGRPRFPEPFHLDPLGEPVAV